jgi:DNA-binding response OmpR family regulator
VKALVVDDDRVLADLVSFTLRREGFEVIQAQDGETAWERWRLEKPDIVILDVNLPRTVPVMDGFAILRRIREKADTPVILLTVRGEEDDIVQGLKLGADDYVVKPFSPRQFVARIEAVLRRSGRNSHPEQIQAGDLFLDTDRREVRLKDGSLVNLTALETRLLAYLMLYPDHVLTMQDISSHVWAPGGGDRDMLRQLVRRVRTKIEPDPAHPTYIETVPGKGYGLRTKPAPEKRAG